MPADGARRTEILDTAADLFASSGLRTSVGEIADACGILPGSLYHHFDSKEAILVELVEAYLAELDAVARAAMDPDATRQPVTDRIMALGQAISRTATRHRAALLCTLYDPPTGASDELANVVHRSPESIQTAMVETLRAGCAEGVIRSSLDLDIVADRLVQVLLHVSLGVFGDVRGSEVIATIRCHTLLRGIATDPPSDDKLDRTAAFDAATRAIDKWDKPEADEDDRLPRLLAVARAEFGRKGYESTTVRDLAAAANMSTGTVYRLIGSKDQLLESIMTSFIVKARSGWTAVLRSDSTSVEKLDALMWVNINAVDRFSDEYNIQLAWLRESPPTSANLGTSFGARLNDVKSLLAKGIRSAELQVDGPSADIRAWSVFELLWMPENIIDDIGVRGALRLARETTLRGAADRSDGV